MTFINLAIYDINQPNRSVCVCLDNADCVLKPYEFKMEEIESFRYRCRVRLFCFGLIFKV